MLGVSHSLSQKPVWLRISVFLERLSFRGIYFPQVGRLAWLKVAEIHFPQQKAPPVDLCFTGSAFNYKLWAALYAF